MPNYLHINDPNPNDGIRHEHTFSGYLNYDGVIVGTGVRVIGLSGTHLDGNNLSGSIGLTLEGDSTFEGSIQITNFGAGIFGSGYGNHIIAAYHGSIDVGSVRSMGVAVSGGATVQNVSVTSVTNPDGNSFGFVGWGGGNNFWHNDVSNVNGAYESVSLSMGYGGSAYDFHAVGSPSGAGRSFGLWAGSGGPIDIQESSFVGFDSAIANVSHVTLTNTVASGLVYDVVNRDTLRFTDAGGNSFHVIGSSGSGTITGTSGVDHILGSAGDDTIISGGGSDVIYGGLGADTFVFRATPGMLGVAPDYNMAEGDRFYLVDHFPTSVVTFDETRCVMQVDGVDYVHVPGAATIADIAFFF